MPSTPPPSVSPIRSALDPTGGWTSRGVVAVRLAVVLAAAAGMAGLTVATAGAAGPAARAAGARSHPAAASTTRVHIEAVSAPVLVTAAQLQQAQQSSAPPAPAPATATAVTIAAAPAVSRSSSTPAASSGGTGTDLGTFMVTCYDIHGQTKSGEQAGPQSVAVDPSVIPLGTEIYIDGVGYRRADDTGGGVQGHHIDIWESSYSACANFGRQYRDVHRVG